MELTRRDALGALAAVGVTFGAGAATLRLDEHEGAALGTSDVETLAALAEVLYPSAAEGVPAFVERYVVARTRSRPEYLDGMLHSIAALDEYAEKFYDARFAALDPPARERLLSELSVDVADPDPDGADRERIRHYLVNDLLFAFYASPAGGRLVGIENPPGHPGGIVSYRRGSPDG